MTDEKGVRAGIDGHGEGVGSLVEAWRRMEPVDLVALLGVPAALVAVFALERSVKLAYVLDYRQPTVVTAYAAHFVHLTADHLVSNLAGYAVLVPLVYVFCVLGGRRRAFYAVSATFLAAFPFALSALNVVLVRPRIGFGFSGIVLAYLGFLPVALAWYLAGRFDDRFGVVHSPVLFFLGLGLIAFWAVPPTLTTAVVGAAAFLAGGLYLRTAVAEVGQGPRAFARRMASGRVSTAAASVGVSLSLLFPVAAFPPDPVSHGSVLNVYSHLLGYCLGYIVPFVAFGLLGIDLE